MIRSEALDRMLPIIRSGEKISEGYFSGVYFLGKFCYIIGKGIIGRILIDDRILPAEPLTYKNDEIIAVSENIIKQIAEIDWQNYNFFTFLRKKDIISLFPPELTLKRQAKSTVGLTVSESSIFAKVFRKKEIMIEKKISAASIIKKQPQINLFQGKIKINLFNLEKFVLEIIPEYDIIGVHTSRYQMNNIKLSCHRLDKSKPMIDCILWEEDT